jgi:hypothetical protein
MSDTGEKPETIEGRAAHLAKIGCSDDEIADLLNLNGEQVQALAPEIEKGRKQRKEELLTALYDTARKGNASLLMWIAKQEFTGAATDSDEPRPYRNLSDAELREEIRRNLQILGYCDGQCGTELLQGDQGEGATPA